jgi:predicted dehydrogenase
MKKVRWGILGVAGIAVRKVIPAMQSGELTEVVGIASRDRGKAEEAAKTLGIPRAYGSYEELLADPEIDAIYNPLPNHLHVPVSIQAAEAGKHVLCEKPVGLDTADALKLLAARDRTGVVIGEAFMVQVHPQWVRTVELVREGKIGDLRYVVGAFGYYNDNFTNIRHVREWGGPCRMAAPEVSAVARELAGRAVVLKVDTERYPELAARYRVQGIPNFLVIRDGRVVMQKAGLTSRHEMRRWLEAA